VLLQLVGQRGAAVGGKPRPADPGAGSGARMGGASPAARLLLTDTLARLLAKQANEARRASRSGKDFEGWLKAHGPKFSRALAAALTPLAGVLALDATAAALRVALLTADGLRAGYNTDTPPQWAARLDGWAGRAGGLAGGLLGEAGEAGEGEARRAA